MKKLNQKGFTHHLVMFVILAVVLGAMGFAGYRVWQNKNIDAEAYTYATVAKGGGVAIRACHYQSGIIYYYVQNRTSRKLTVDTSERFMVLANSNSRKHTIGNGSKGRVWWSGGSLNWTASTTNLIYC